MNGCQTKIKTNWRVVFLGNRILRRGNNFFSVKWRSSFKEIGIWFSWYPLAMHSHQFEQIVLCVVAIPNEILFDYCQWIIDIFLWIVSSAEMNRIYFSCFTVEEKKIWKCDKNALMATGSRIINKVRIIYYSTPLAEFLYAPWAHKFSRFPNFLDSRTTFSFSNWALTSY